MLFNFDGMVLHNPLPHSMCPAECQGQKGDELLESFWVFDLSCLQAKATGFQAAKQGIATGYVQNPAM